MARNRRAANIDSRSKPARNPALDNFNSAENSSDQALNFARGFNYSQDLNVVGPMLGIRQNLHGVLSKNLIIDEKVTALLNEVAAKDLERDYLNSGKLGKIGKVIHSGLSTLPGPERATAIGGRLHYLFGGFSNLVDAKAHLLGPMPALDARLRLVLGPSYASFPDGVRTLNDIASRVRIAGSMSQIEPLVRAYDQALLASGQIPDQDDVSRKLRNLVDLLKFEVQISNEVQNVQIFEEPNLRDFLSRAIGSGPALESVLRGYLNVNMNELLDRNEYVPVIINYLRSATEQGGVVDPLRVDDVIGVINRFVGPLCPPGAIDAATLTTFETMRTNFTNKINEMETDYRSVESKQAELNNLNTTEILAINTRLAAARAAKAAILTPTYGGSRGVLQGRYNAAKSAFDANPADAALSAAFAAIETPWNNLLAKEAEENAANTELRNANNRATSLNSDLVALNTKLANLESFFNTNIANLLTFCGTHAPGAGITALTDFVSATFVDVANFAALRADPAAKVNQLFVPSTKAAILSCFDNIRSDMNNYAPRNKVSPETMLLMLQKREAYIQIHGHEPADLPSIGDDCDLQASLNVLKMMSTYKNTDQYLDSNWESGE